MTIGTSTSDRSAPITRERSRRGEGDRLRHDLLDAAAELMSTHGSVDQVSLRAVARQAGVSPTAVYRHFDDHLDLLRESVRFCWANFLAALDASFEADDDPFVAFRSCGEAYCRFADENQGQYRVLFSNRIGLGDSEAPDGQAAFDLLVGLVTRIMDVSDDDRDPFFVAVQVHTWIHGIVDLCTGPPEGFWPDLDVMLDNLADSLRLSRSTALP